MAWGPFCNGGDLSHVGAIVSVNQAEYLSLDDRLG